MEGVKLYIHTKNRDYGERLARFAASQHNPWFRVEQLTERKDKTEFDRNDYVLSDDGEWLHRLGCHTVQLTEHPGGSENKKIFMYQSRDKVYRQMLELTGTKDESTGNVSRESRVICIFSPEGGDAKTVLALRMARELAQAHAVLYISLCGFPVFFGETFCEEPEPSRAGLSELLLCADCDGFEETLKKLVFSVGRISMISPVQNYKDLLDYSPAEMTEFMKALKKQKQFPAVILEMGQMFEYSLKFLSGADEVIIPREDGFLAAVKKHVLQRYCQMERQDELWNRIRYEPVKGGEGLDLEQIRQILCDTEGGS